MTHLNSAGPTICFAALLLLSSCPQQQATYLPATMPVLQAVFRPGTKPMLVPHDLGGEYEVLPAASVIIRLAAPWPNFGGGMEVTLDGTDIQQVASNDIQTQSQLSAAGTGFYTLQITSTTFDVYVVPPPAKQHGPRVAIQIINHAVNPPQGTTVLTATLNISAITPAAKTMTEPSDVFFDCGGGQYNDEDTNLGGEWFYDCKPSSSIIARNVVLAGWLDSAPTVSCPARCVEDIHYILKLDPDFIQQLYGDSTFDTPLTGAVLPGHSMTGGPGTPRPFQDISQVDGSSRGIDMNSFILPNQLDNPVVYIQVELNCWHVLGTNDLLTRNWSKRGPAPAGWFNKAFGDGHTTDGDCWWAYDPDKPDKSAGPPQAGTYVRMKGTIWQDFSHPGISPWESQFLYPAFGGWLEMHPPDWIEVVDPAPAPTKTVQMVSLAGGPGPAQIVTKDVTIPAPGPQPPGTTLQCVETIDARFTKLATVDAHTCTKLGDHAAVHVQVHQTIVGGAHHLTSIPGAFKAIYVVFWQ